MQKKILLITYHFPPSPAVGGLRIFNLAKHLPGFGWDTEVLTIRPSGTKHMDHSRLNEIPDTKIHRTTCLPTLLDLYMKFKSVYFSLIEMKHITQDDLQKAYVHDNTKIRRENFRGRFKSLLISVFFILPDRERGWILPAVLKALKLIKKNRYDFILTSCPPYSVHLIGLILKKLTGVPWVADFRDPWYKGSYKKLYLTTDISKKIEEKLESEVLLKADLIMTTTQRLCDVFSYFCIEELKQEKEKCICQTNGYDEQLMARIQTNGKYEHFTITYTGSLYFGRTPEPIFQAVNQLIAVNAIKADEIHIKLVGHCDRIENKPIEAVIEKYGLNGIVQISNPVPYEESIKIIKRSHLALLLAPDQPLQIPAKVFDYIGAGTPILTITQKGATYDLIQRTGIGGAFYPDDIEGLSKFIKFAFENNEELESHFSAELMQSFTSRSLSANVAVNLNKGLDKDKAVSELCGLSLK